MEMIKLTKGFSESNKHIRVGLDLFGYGVTKTGDYFCDVNSLKTHPELFKNIQIEYINIDPKDVFIPEIDE